MENYIEASWDLLGLLNADRVATTHFDNTKDYIEVAADLSLMKAFPIYSWIVENANRKYSDTKDELNYIRSMYEFIKHGSKLSLELSNINKKYIKQLNSHFSSVSSSSFLVKTGDRENAQKYLKEWIENNAVEYVKICDPFFGPADLEYIQLFRTSNPNLRYEVLTSKKQQINEEITDNYHDAYTHYWRMYISAQDIPETKIVIVGTSKKHELPIHDRWIITKGKGLRIGGSLNQLGLYKEMEISELTENEVLIREKEINQYLMCLVRTHEEETVQYSMVQL